MAASHASQAFRRGRGPAGPAVRRSSSRPWCGGLLSTSTSPVYRSDLQRTPLIIAKVSARYDSLSLLMIDRPASQHHGTPLTADRPECIANRPRLQASRVDVEGLDSPLSLGRH